MSMSWQVYYLLQLPTECDETVFNMTQSQHETKILPQDTIHMMLNTSSLVLPLHTAILSNRMCAAFCWKYWTGTTSPFSCRSWWKMDRFDIAPRLALWRPSTNTVSWSAWSSCTCIWGTLQSRCRGTFDRPGLWNGCPNMWVGKLCSVTKYANSISALVIESEESTVFGLKKLVTCGHFCCHTCILDLRCSWTS